VLRKTLMAFAAAAALGCAPGATNAFAAGHPAGHASVGHAAAGHAAGGHPARGRAIAAPARNGHVARSGRGYGYGPAYNAPIYDNCDGYGPDYGDNGCPNYGVPVVGRVINGILNGYAPY
jgi:hypothetical protein